MLRRETARLPLTWFAHQVPMIGMKLARPKWFDATALCIGSMMPDLGSFRLRSYAVLSRRRPPVITTLLCPTPGDGSVGTVVAPLPQGPIDILVGGDRGFCVWRAVGLAGRKDGTN